LVFTPTDGVCTRGDGELRLGRGVYRVSARTRLENLLTKIRTNVENKSVPRELVESLRGIAGVAEGGAEKVVALAVALDEVQRSGRGEGVGPEVATGRSLGVVEAHGRRRVTQLGNFGR